MVCCTVAVHICFVSKIQRFEFSFQGQTVDDINHVAIQLLFPVLRKVIRIDRSLPFAVC